MCIRDRGYVGPILPRCSKSKAPRNHFLGKPEIYKYAFLLQSKYKLIFKFKCLELSCLDHTLICRFNIPEGENQLTPV